MITIPEYLDNCNLRNLHYLNTHKLHDELKKRGVSVVHTFDNNGKITATLMFMNGNISQLFIVNMDELINMPERIAKRVDAFRGQ